MNYPKLSQNYPKWKKKMYSVSEEGVGRKPAENEARRTGGMWVFRPHSLDTESAVKHDAY